MSTGTGNPFDTDAIADFQTGSLTAGTELGDLADSLVATDLPWLGWEWKQGPLAHVNSDFCCVFWVIKYTELVMTPKSEWHTPECDLRDMSDRNASQLSENSINEQINENLSSPRLRHIDIHDLGRDGAGLIEDSRLLLLRDVGSSHDSRCNPGMGEEKPQKEKE